MTPVDDRYKARGDEGARVGMACSRSISTCVIVDVRRLGADLA